MADETPCIHEAGNGREFATYRNEKFWRQSSGRYLQSGDKTANERLLHRRVYADTFGPIPKGYHVHHQDGDWRNNTPENLQLVEPKAHGRQHMLERIARDPAANAANLAKAREAARAWHGSPEGLEWHREQGKFTWSFRRQTVCHCKRCGKEFLTYWPEKAKYCSKSCTQARAYTRYFDDPRTCDACGTTFLANRHRKVRFCSRACSVRHVPRGFVRPADAAEPA